MVRKSGGNMAHSGAALESGDIRARQPDIDMFYALVGGGKGAAKASGPSRTAVAPTVTSAVTPAAADALPTKRAAPVPLPPRPAVVAGLGIAPVPAGGASPAWAASLQPAARNNRAATPVAAVPSRRNQASWSPRVLCMHLVERVDRMQVDSWVRKVSGDAMNRLNQAQSRLNANRPK